MAYGKLVIFELKKSFDIAAKLETNEINQNRLLLNIDLKLNFFGINRIFFVFIF